MDIFEIIDLHFKTGRYKQRPDLIDAVSTKARISEMIEKRRGARRNAAFEKRKIPVDMSPATPLAKKPKKTLEVVAKPVDHKLKEQQEKLIKWKADKLRKKQEHQKNAKPRFLVTHVNVSIGLPDLENVNREIKGKKFKSKFAPVNHQFKAPANIKPLQFLNDKIAVKQEQQPSQIVTRSRGLSRKASPVKKTRSKSDKENKEEVQKNFTKKNGVIEKVKSQKPNNKLPQKKNISKKLEALKEKTFNTDKAPIKEKTSLKEKTPLREKTPIREKTLNKTSQRKSSSKKLETLDEKTPNKLKNKVLSQIVDETVSQEDIVTPTKNVAEAPVYISPFVTVSRGKQNARKEYEARRSGKSFYTEKNDTAQCISPKAGAKYFTWALNNEVSRFEDLCNTWNAYKTQTNLSEEVISMIDVAIGQATLFITKKCEQFRGLIENCIEKNSENPVTCEDLHGFWDMMLIQVKNLNLRFENLDNLKANNWEEIRPEIIQKAAKPRGRPKKKVGAISSLKSAIEAARKQKLADKGNEIATETERSNVKNNRLSVVQTSGKKRISSPGLTIMKVAQYAKNAGTPGKSILKADSVRHTKSHNKSVIFFEDIDATIQTTTKSSAKIQTSSRTSARLSRTKLF